MNLTNIGQNLQSYLTPIFITVLVAYVLWCIYSLTSKKHRKVWGKLGHKKVDVQREAIKKITMSIGMRVIVLFFLIFAYFFAYGPSEVGMIQYVKESGQMEYLEEAQGETMTPQELKKDADERRDVTNYLEDVGNKDALKEEEERNARLIEETLKKHNKGE